MRPLLVLLAISIALPAWAQVSKEANAGYQTREQRAGVARNLDNPERESNDKPRELLDQLGIKQGDVIADIGTGVGFMIPYFLELIGPEGKLYAQDIQQDFLDTVNKKKAEHGWKNVETVLGEQTEPGLPDNVADLAFILDVYHHINYPQETLRNVARAIKPDGKLAVVDFYRSRKHPRMSDERLKSHIRKDRDGFKAEIESAR